MIRPKYEKATRPKRKTIGERSRAAIDMVRPWIFDRDEHQCVVSGSAWINEYPCSGRLTIQHAVGRGMGGSALYDQPAYLRTMCDGHNTLAESDSRFARICIWAGWSMSRNRNDQNPEHIPVRYPDGRDYLLYNAGYGRSLLMRDEAAELRALNGMEPA